MASSTSSSPAICSPSASKCQHIAVAWALRLFRSVSAADQFTLRLWWGRIRNVNRDMPRTRIIDGCDTGMSARPVREHEIEIIPDDVPVLVGVQKIERYLGRLFHLVGKCLLDFRFAFQHAQNTTTKDRILDVKVCDVAGIAAVIGSLPI